MVCIDTIFSVKSLDERGRGNMMMFIGVARASSIFVKRVAGEKCSDVGREGTQGVFDKGCGVAGASVFVDGEQPKEARCRNTG